MYNTTQAQLFGHRASGRAELSKLRDELSLTELLIEGNLIRKREIAALRATVLFCWPGGGLRPLGQPFSSTASSVIGVQLAQEGRVAGGYSIDGPIGGSVGRPVTMDGGAVNRTTEAQHARESRQETPAHLPPRTATP